MDGLLNFDAPVQAGGRRQGNDDIVAALRLARSRGVGPLTWRRLVERFGGAPAALAAWPELARRHKIDTRIPDRAEAAAELDRLEALGGRLLVLGQPGYPLALAEIADPPPVLALLGDANALTQASVAVVGSRNASLNGCSLARDLAEGLVACGRVLVSGLARGIDTAAHLGALQAVGEGPATVAVLAGGLDQPYPPENAGLMARIVERGAVVSEVALGTAPRARHFPRRNRIIAGLAQATLVIEAALKSGSLITARLANEQGREVLAVPGSPLDARSRGCNALLREGATLVETLDDILNVLPAAVSLRVEPRSVIRRPPRAAPAQDTAPPPPAAEPAGLDGQQQIEALLSAAPTDIDALVRDTGLPAAAVSGLLLELEMAGRLIRHTGNKVSLQPPA